MSTTEKQQSAVLDLQNDPVLQKLMKPPTPLPFDDLIDEKEERAITQEIEKLRLAQLSLRELSNNKEITHVSSKLANAIDQTATYLRNKKFYANPRDENAVKPNLGQNNSNPLMQRLAEGIMKRTTDKMADKYKDTIQELVTFMDPIEEECSPQKTSGSDAEEGGDVRFGSPRQQQLSHPAKSPFTRFSRHINFPFSKQQIEEDKPLNRLIELGKKREHEEFKKLNPISTTLLEGNQIFQGISKFFNSELKDINRKMEKEKRRFKDVKVVMTNKHGSEEEFTVPQDVKKLFDPKKLLRRSINLARMQKPNQNRFSADFSKTGGLLSPSGGSMDTTLNLLKSTFNTNDSRAVDKNAAYTELRSKIATSQHNLIKIKNGQGALPGGFIGEANNIPFLTNQNLQDDLKSYLRSGEIFIPKAVMPGIVKKKSKQKSQMLILHTSPSTKNNQSPSLEKPLNLQTTDSLDKKQSTMASANMDISGSIQQVPANHMQFSQMLQGEMSLNRKPLIGLLPIINDRSRSTQLQEDSLFNLPLFQTNQQSTQIQQDNRGVVTVLSQNTSIVQEEDDYELKDLNQIGPICLTNRKFNRQLEKKLIFPRNPSHDPSLKKKPSKFTAKDPSSLPSLVEYCHEKNVPFYENEMRYFDILKGKQNFKEWTDNWKRYCNQNLLEEKKKEVKDVKQNKFLMALMAMAKRAQEENPKVASPAETQQGKPPTQISPKKANQDSPPKIPNAAKEAMKEKFSSTQVSSPKAVETLKKSFQKKFSFIRRESPSKATTFIASKTILKQLSPEEKLILENKKLKSRIDSIVDKSVNIKSKEVRGLLHEPMRMEQLDGLPETTPQEIQKKKRRRRRKTITDPSKAPKFYEKLEARRNNINQKLLRILERVELDRPIILREKFKVLWNMDSQHASNSKHMKIEIGKLKTARNQVNAHMAENYMHILNYIEERYLKTLSLKDTHKSQITGIQVKKTGQIENAIKPHECERKFMDFIRIIIEGGWVVQDNLEWVQILEFLEIGEELHNRQIRDFFKYVSQVFNFEETFNASFIDNHNNESMIYYGEITAEDDYDSGN